MKTPIYDFVKKYSESAPVRMHMPGHKGRGPLGIEAFDITEISGADSLYDASGVINESEKTASALFGCKTLYSTEGSSLTVRAMVYMISVYAKENGKPQKILAARGAHKSFLYATALVNLEVEWLYPRDGASYLSAFADADELEELFKSKKDDEMPVAVYITSPDYLGGMCDVKGISEICKKYGVLLAVDNAHGAYLGFLEKSEHPIANGADICCDSAHKTLPVLTPGAYLHISDKAPESFSLMAKGAMALFASTSPSYLVLQSLDLANPYLEGLKEKIKAAEPKISELKKKISALGFTLYGKELLKITLCPRLYGYTGTELADILRGFNVECEFADNDYTVLMISPELSENDGEIILNALASVKRKSPLPEIFPKATCCIAVMSPREAIFSPKEEILAEQALGRILAEPSVGCPPAVPILICGEKIDKAAIEAFNYYGIKKVSVVKE